MTRIYRGRQRQMLSVTHADAVCTRLRRLNILKRKHRVGGRAVTRIARKPQERHVSGDTDKAKMNMIINTRL